MYKGFRIRNSEFWYASPKCQLFMVAMVCFLCPGMFNAIVGMGGAGQLSTLASDDANTALYSTFAVVGFFAGTFANRLGIRLTMSIGGLGYCLYAASFLSYSHDQNLGFVVFAGAFLGVCAGLLWTGQGAIMMSYPPEQYKGRYISWFWIIFNLGAVVGALIPLGQNVNNQTGAVTDGTYAAFIVLMFVGAVLALFLCNADRVQREDGSHVILMKNPSWQTEILGLWETLYQDPWIVLLFPMFFASNVFYTYQTNDMNAGQFNTRTRALNNVLYWSAQIFGAVIFGYSLDYGKMRRSLKARIAFITLFVLTFIIWGGGWAWQKDQPSRAETSAKTFVGVDWTDGGHKYIAPMFLYIFYGFFDACWQTTIYWTMGALSNNSRKAANLAGFYKGIQSAGAAIFWRVDALGKPYNTIFGATWGLLAAALLIASPIIWLRVQDTVPLEEDLKFTDETVEDVVGGAAPDTQKTVV
ncbi:MFS general substrate transporter [Cryphonectria parasitica EP155]|uniref:MFS general substrate transporter n=1 Tax=Cryphonectria parasitica (strain ATCC 38755 / EP155) TaxID=660469 RepID=A0A9P4Y369_CRYP1|nr:MFS general substrate transporter [Cryphonectria parasitica EP155]KAF3765610.1 MFS general substrate transporter [Cryphonectria parasitica EP155]